MEVEERKGEEIEQAASESRHLADELEGMLDQLKIEEERSAAVNAVVLGEQEEVEELKEREEEERTRKGHEAEQRVEEEAERPARETEVSCVGIRQKRPSVIVATRSRKLAIEDETNNKDAAVEISDADVSPAESEKEKEEREVLGQASLDAARISWIFGYLEDGYLDIWKMKHDKEKETTAHGHVGTLSTAERVRGIKKEITLDED